jgi:hypothetical protein
MKGVFLMVIVRIIQWIAGLAGLAALALGLLIWFANMDSIISIHMLLGLTVALSLLILGIIAVFTRGVRVLGAFGIVYALILPVFGLTQATLLIGNLHWLIQTAHLLVGIGGIALMGVIGTRYLRLKRAGAKVDISQSTAS